MAKRSLFGNIFFEILLTYDIIAFPERRIVMKIVNLTNTEYRNYAKIHSRRNFGQTIEYSMLRYNVDKRRYFLGLVDDNDNIYAATLLLIHSVRPGIFEAIAPNGYLIDYANFSLVKTFTDELIKFLKKEKVTYLVTNPMFKYHVYDKKNRMIVNNESYLNNLYSLNYKSLGYYSDFERYDVMISDNNSINELYNNFNRNTKRNIKEGIKFGLTLHRGTIKDLDVAYDIIKKKTNNKLAFYQNLMTIYDNKDNKMEIFLAKLNPHQYLVNVQKLYSIEKRKNERLIASLNRHVGNITEKQLNQKINSNNAVERLNQELQKAIKLDAKYKDDITVGTSMIIKNNHEIYFLIDGYKEEFRHIHSTHILKWAIIKKYYEYGYRIFNLGEIYKNYLDKDSKYHTQYLYKIGFGGNVIEYTPNLLLVINKPLYSIYKKINRKK